MARSIDTLVRDMIGNLNIQIAQLTAALEECQERCKELEAQVKTEDK
jgi:hypothetical protein